MKVGAVEVFRFQQPLLFKSFFSKGLDLSRLSNDPSCDVSTTNEDHWKRSPLSSISARFAFRNLPLNSRSISSSLACFTLRKKLAVQISMAYGELRHVHLQSFAQHVAQYSGNFLQLSSVSYLLSSHSNHRYSNRG